MTHEVIKHLLDDYVTGELTEEARAPVEEHIAACEMCSAEVESLKRILARAAAILVAVLSSAGTAVYLNGRASTGRSTGAVASDSSPESTPASLAAFTI